VRLFLSFPPEEHFYRGMGRYLHRRAIQDVVPDLVTWKKTKDMGAISRSDHGTVENFTTVAPEALHPRLIDLLDLERLKRRLAARPEAAGNNGCHLHLEIQRDFQAVRNLDIWLKQRLPVTSRNQCASSGHNLDA
jgi:asparagine synthase (glutamine-hydrolysing)